MRQKDEDENVLNVMLGTSVKSLDAQVATDGESFEVIAGFTDGLMQMDANGATVNALAESYTVSDDSKTYTFKIRDAVLGRTIRKSRRRISCSAGGTDATRRKNTRICFRILPR